MNLYFTMAPPSYVVSAFRTGGVGGRSVRLQADPWGAVMQRTSRFVAVTLAVGLVTLIDSATRAQTPARPSTARGEWPTYAGDLAGTKYSPQDQITRDNFASLKVAWRIKSPDAFLSMTLPGGDECAADRKLILEALKR